MKKRHIPENVLNYIEQEIGLENLDKVIIELNENSNKIDIITEMQKELATNNSYTRMEEIKKVMEEVDFGKVIIMNKGRDNLQMKTAKRYRIMKEEEDA